MTRRSTPSLGTRLRDARHAAGLSLTTLSQRSGIAKPSLSRYENDHITPSLGTLRKISRALEVDPSSLVSEPVNNLDAFVRALRDAGVSFPSAAEADIAGQRFAEQLCRGRARRA